MRLLSLDFGSAFVSFWAQCRVLKIKWSSWCVSAGNIWAVETLSKLFAFLKQKVLSIPLISIDSHDFPWIITSDFVVFWSILNIRGSLGSSSVFVFVYIHRSKLCIDSSQGQGNSHMGIAYAFLFAPASNITIFVDWSYSTCVSDRFINTCKCKRIWNHDAHCVWTMVQHPQWQASLGRYSNTETHV